MAAVPTARIRPGLGGRLGNFGRQIEQLAKFRRIADGPGKLGLPVGGDTGFQVVGIIIY